MTTFQCPSDILIMSCWLCTARWSTWPGNHLVPCVAKSIGSHILIHAYRGLPDPKCLSYPSGLFLCLSTEHICLVPANDMVHFHNMVCNCGLVSYTILPFSAGLGLCTSCEKVHFFLVLLDSQTKLPVEKLSMGSNTQLCTVRWFYRTMLCIDAVYAGMRFCVSACVCVSVCPSRSWVASKQIKISSKFFHHRVAKPF